MGCVIKILYSVWFKLNVLSCAKEHSNGGVKKYFGLPAPRKIMHTWVEKARGRFPDVREE